MPAGKRCPKCTRIVINGRTYCPTHAREYEGRRGTPTQRGYDQAHRVLRAAWQARIDSGQRVVCATCQTVLTGRAWDLGHDHQRGGYIGPQCPPCNRGEAGRRGRATQT